MKCELIINFYFEEGSAAAVGLESRDPDDRDVIKEQWTGIHLNVAGEQTGKVLDVPILNKQKYFF